MNPLVLELIECFWTVLQDLILHYAVTHDSEPTTIHVTKELENLLITFYESRKTNFPANGIRGWDHIHGMRPVWDAPHFMLSGEFSGSDIRSADEPDKSPSLLGDGILPGPR